METDAAGLMQGCKKKCGNEDAFLLRDAMRKHGLCCGPVFGLSVRHVGGLYPDG